jgi:hypothetical protein
MALEEWGHGSVYEPNVTFADGRWKMWFVAGSNQDLLVFFDGSYRNEEPSGFPFAVTLGCLEIERPPS